MVEVAVDLVVLFDNDEQAFDCLNHHRLNIAQDYYRNYLGIDKMDGMMVVQPMVHNQ